jgi:hypothetical protein
MSDQTGDDFSVSNEVRHEGQIFAVVIAIFPPHSEHLKTEEPKARTKPTMIIAPPIRHGTNPWPSS